MPQLQPGVGRLPLAFIPAATGSLSQSLTLAFLPPAPGSLSPALLFPLPVSVLPLFTQVILVTLGMSFPYRALHDFVIPPLG